MEIKEQLATVVLRTVATSAAPAGSSKTGAGARDRPGAAAATRAGQ